MSPNLKEAIGTFVGAFREARQEKVAIAPNFIVNATGEVFPPDEALKGQARENQLQLLDFASKYFGEVSKKLPAYQLHADWFTMALNLEQRETSVGEKYQAIIEFCQRHGFYEPGQALLSDPTPGPGFELVDGQYADPDNSVAGALLSAAVVDYERVKKNLAVNPKTFKALLRGQQLSESDFRKRESLLLSDYRKLLEVAALATGGRKILEVGPGKGECTIIMADHGFTVCTVDTQSPQFIRQNLQFEWQAKHPDISMVHLQDSGEVIRTKISQGQLNKEYMYTIQLTGTAEENSNLIDFVEAQGLRAIFVIQADASENIPLKPESMNAAGSIYVLHHVADNMRTAMIAEMARVTKHLTGSLTEKGLVIVDASKNAEHFLKMTLWVMAKLGSWFTGLDAIITHARGWTEESARKLAGQVLPENGYFVKALGPEAKKTPFGPIIYSQLIALTGFEPKRLKQRLKGVKSNS